MKRVKLIVTALVLAVLAVLAGRVTAQQITFTGAVEMPGLTLQPGTYVFRLADSPTRNVVQVLDEGEKNILGQWTFVQADRPRVTEETLVMFKETREGATPAIQYWYFPGEKIGKEFIYPKDQAERIAARTGVKVRSSDGVIEGSIADVKVAEASPAPAEPAKEPEPAPVVAAAPPAEPAPAPAAVADAAPAPEPAPAPVVEESRVAANQAQSETRPVATSGQTELPRTASPLMLSGLLGLLSLAGAAGLRLSRG
jgi:hypothetical protein